MKNLPYLVILAALIFSCSKDEDIAMNPAPIAPASSQFIQLEVGNYWIYQVSMCDSMMQDCNEWDPDTIFISGDTLINGNQFAVMEGSRFVGLTPKYVRDSLGYLVDPEGDIHFASNDFRDSLHTTEFFLFGEKMTEISYTMRPKFGLSVPAGTFDCLDYRGTQFSAVNNFTSPRKKHTFYAKDVGVVKMVNTLVYGPEILVRELVKYRVQE